MHQGPPTPLLDALRLLEFPRWKALFFFLMGKSFVGSIISPTISCYVFVVFFGISAPLSEATPGENRAPWEIISRAEKDRSDRERADLKGTVRMILEEQVNITRAEVLKLDPDAERRLSRIVVYDEQGRLVTEDIFDKELGLFAKAMKTYDVEGNLVAVIEDLIGWMKDWDLGGRLHRQSPPFAGTLKSPFQGYVRVREGEEAGEHSRMLFFYDEQGNLVSIRESRSSWEMEEQEKVFVYDVAKGRIEMKSPDFAELMQGKTKEFTTATVAEYTRHSDGAIECVKEYAGNGFERRRYTAQGHLTEEEIYNKKGSPLRQRFVYDYHGHLVEATQYDGQGKPSLKVSLEYDARGFKSREVYLWGHDIPVCPSVFRYETDSLGNWTKQTEFRSCEGQEKRVKATNRKLTYYYLR